MKFLLWFIFVRMKAAGFKAVRLFFGLPLRILRRCHGRTGSRRMGLRGEIKNPQWGLLLIRFFKACDKAKAEFTLVNEHFAEGAKRRKSS
jgi:hypothetical protein